jgi:roadblock/LC7 domain-containing protein
MKNKKTNEANILRLLGIIALVAVIGFSTVSCSIIPDDDTTTYSLDGIWRADRGVSDHIVTISGSTGVFTQISSLAAWQDAINKGYVKAGDQKFRNITKTGDRTWTAQGYNVVYNTPSPNVAIDARWSDTFTITLNANGLSFSDGSITWTKTTLSLDGNWQGERGVSDHVVTISGSTGVFVQIYSHPLWQDAISKGYVKVGDQKFRNLRNTGGLTWTGESFNVVYNTPAPNVAVGTNWTNYTITMNANGLSFNDGSITWTRR